MTVYRILAINDDGLQVACTGCGNKMIYPVQRKLTRTKVEEPEPEPVAEEIEEAPAKKGKARARIRR
jgi:hypothetical protein